MGGGRREGGEEGGGGRGREGEEGEGGKEVNIDMTALVAACV